MVIYMLVNEKFLNLCINNRIGLELSCKEMASYLVDVSEKEYIAFEKGKYSMSENNLRRICRVLCVKPTSNFKVEDYIEVDGLSEEEYEDLSKVIETIVGDNNA